MVFTVKARKLEGQFLFVKRIDLHGFKSFADKTTFTLTPGITVIVGPNGCGKSNIADAVRWVLGEQSARYLRGTRMDDVIFNGTAHRKPLSFAEVSVTFDHSDGILGLDYQEITVTRRIYRNGESEYLLNKQPCRLKDILELFTDTGVGKEAYSIIGQGRVDEIIQAKPEERRYIFEEAAGIIKYKNRKREAQRRLAETAENILRLGDVIAELSAQVEPLAEQARQAKTYLAYREELKACEVDVLVSDALELRQKWQELEAELKLLADEIVEQQALVTQTETQLAQCQLDLDAKQSQVTEKQRLLQQLATELERQLGQIALKKEKIHSAEQWLAQWQANQQELKKEEAALNEERRQIAEKMVQMQGKIEAAEKELAEFKAELAALEAAPESIKEKVLQKELDELLEKIRRLKTEQEKILLEKKQITEQKQNLQKELETNSWQQEKLQRQKQSLQEKKRLELEQKENLTAQREQTQKETEVLQKQKSILEAKLQQRERNLWQKKNRLHVHQELEKAMAGYYQGVKTVLAAAKAGKLSGLYGTVADILTVPAEYVTAIEAALGASLQNIVTENENEAKTAIAYLKKVKGGRATFLPLNIIKPSKRRPVPAEITSLPGYLGVAADLVVAEKRFQPIVESLLGRIHVVSNLDAALAAARIFHYQERIVTLEGDMLFPGGALSGGVEKKQSGVLTRRKEAALLQAEVKKELTDINNLQKEKEKLAQKVQLMLEEEKQLLNKLQQIDLALKLTAQEEKYNAEQLVLARQREETLKQELHTIELKWQQISTLEEELAQKFAILQLEEESKRQELSQMAGLQRALELKKRDAQERYTECRVQLAAYRQQLEFLEQERKRNHKQYHELQERLRQWTEEREETAKQCNRLEKLLAEDQEKAAALQEEYNQLAFQLQEEEKMLKMQTTQFREESQKLRQLEKTVQALERKQNRRELERQRLETEIQAIVERLRDSWDLDFATAAGMARPVPEKKIAREKIQALKARMQALGTVNLGAIEEHQRVVDRLDFLNGQKTDLEIAKTDLLRIIAEIDKRMGEKFASSFAEINRSFQQVFAELFGGGRAQLRLTNPQVPLESGVEIEAQPPGKKLQNLSLLSGGEKALTAIALLFAFLKVRPTPFCILDEIEAALDEANLARFSKYLRSLAKQTQFILISHRKKTMEQADLLYGVTMEEAGVSKIISVRLRDYNLKDNVSA